MHTKNKQPTFHDIAVNGDSESAEDVKRLIEAGADFEERDETGRTPLMVAALNENIKVFEIMRASGANINAQDENGLTVLDHWLKQLSKYETAAKSERVLLESHPDPAVAVRQMRENLDPDVRQMRENLSIYIKYGAARGQDISNSTLLRTIVPHPWMAGFISFTFFVVLDNENPFGNFFLPVFVGLFLLSGLFVGLINRLWARIYGANLDAINQVVDYWWLQIVGNYDSESDSDGEKFNELWDANTHIKPAIWRRIISKYITPPEHYYPQNSIIHKLDKNIAGSMFYEQVVPKFVQRTLSLDSEDILYEFLGKVHHLAYNEGERHWVSVVITLFVCGLIVWIYNQLY